ncbi:MAG: hemerythrin family protein [Gammaproteobacteria bacterium]|nr:hemerythrin family protein [Gammaproteobacteria bacterium]
MKKYLKWRNTWSLGIDAIDLHHQQIAVMFNNIVEIYLDSTKQAAETDQQSCLMHRLLVEFNEKVRKHFCDEEELMQQANYPGRIEHAREHLMLLAELKHYLKNIEDELDLINLNTLKSLKAWFISHIMNSDKKFAEHLHMQSNNTQYNMCHIPEKQRNAV